MDDTKKLNEEQEQKVSGGEGDEKPKHICPYCGMVMVFSHYQDYSAPAVYICPRCGDEEAFSS